MVRLKNKTKQGTQRTENKETTDIYHSVQETVTEFDDLRENRRH